MNTGIESIIKKISEKFNLNEYILKLYISLNKGLNL